MRKLNNEELRLYDQETLILEFTEAVCVAMDKKGIGKKALAWKLGRNRAYITTMLDGRAKLTIRQMSDIMFHLDMKARFK